MIAIDGTGIKMTNRGEWLRKKRNGYIKICGGSTSRPNRWFHWRRLMRGKKLVPLVRKAEARVKNVLGDSGYDCHENFEFLAASGIEAALKVGEDSNPNCGGKREEVVRAYLKDPPGWKKRMGYGQRWMAETHLEDSSGSSAR